MFLTLPGTIKALYDSDGNRIEKGTPGNPVTIFGLKADEHLPAPGSSTLLSESY